MIIFLLILLLVSIILEGTVTALPLVILCLICMTICLRNSIVFFPAFIAGIFLDAFALRPIGGTSVFFLVTVFLILLYQRKYEINSYPFILLASFLSSFLYLFIFDYHGAIVLSCVSSVIAVLLFACYRLSVKGEASRVKSHYS